MSTVMGIDQSLRATGVFWHGENLIGWREINPGTRRGSERLLFIKQIVAQCVDQISPLLVTLEGYSYGSAGKVFQLGELGGVLRVTMEEKRIPTLIVAPSQVKKFITGNHQAEKQEVVDAINSRLHLKWTLKHNNLADAASLAYIASSFLDPSKVTLRYEAEVITALKKSVAPKEKKVHARRKYKFPKM